VQPDHLHNKSGSPPPSVCKAPSPCFHLPGWRCLGPPVVSAAMEEAIIRTEELKKSFGDVQAVKGVDLAVEQGTVFGLLGPNGAGKTTTIRILTTLLEPDEGTAVVAGFDVVRDAVLLRPMIGLAGQFAAVDENLTGLENLEMVGRLYHLPRAEARRRAEEVLERFDLAEAAHRMAKTYSGGMRRRLDVGASLVGQPKVLFMDEPTTGLDPRSRLVLWELIRALQREGTTLLLCTQYLEEADQLCDRIAVIDLGTVIAEGTSEELKDKIGGEVLELHVAVEDLARAAETLRGLGAGDPTIDEETRLIRVPVGAQGPSVLLETVRRLDDADLEIEAIALHRPTLDDVFLSLTGHAAETAIEDVEEPEPEPEKKRRGRRDR
jgi:ABC-2 type transport system ATP-binding protein